MKDDNLTLDEMERCVAGLRREFGSFFDDALRVFAKHDPLDIGSGESDEYSPEVRLVLSRWMSVRTLPTLRETVRQVLREMIEPGEDELSRQIADE